MDGGVGLENPGVVPDFPLSTVGLATSVEMSLGPLSLFPDPSALSSNLCLSRLSLCWDPSLLPIVGSLYPDLQPLSHLPLSSHPPNGLRPPPSKRPLPGTCLLVSLSPTPALLCKSGDLIYTTRVDSPALLTPAEIALPGVSHQSPPVASVFWRSSPGQCPAFCFRGMPHWVICPRTLHLPFAPHLPLHQLLPPQPPPISTDGNSIFLALRAPNLNF